MFFFVVVFFVVVVFFFFFFFCCCFFDGAIHRQDRLFTFFSNGQGLRFVGKKEQKKTSFFLFYLISSYSPWSFKSVTRKSITYNYMLYKGVVVSKINNHYSIIYLGLTN